MSPEYIVSACLAGFNTRYDGSNCMDENVKRLVMEGGAIALCPEQLAGLPTPRPAVNLSGGDGCSLLDGKARAIGADGRDYTEALKKGAEEAMRIASVYGIKKAVLKDGSPSCGVTYIYVVEGRAKGSGVTSGLLKRNGIEVIDIVSL